MSRDRLIQLVAAVVAAAALLTAALLVPVVNKQRRDLQLSFDTAVGDGTKPSYAILAAGLGSFKGMAVNTLWYRAEMEKREGRYAEANILAEWITEMQPRFPQVWAFQAWNLAYNISVGTYTPQERWDWVSKGIVLLRDEGIPYNPNSVRLYRELAWILFHKVGQFTDDMNWYYKAEVAREWQEVLGGPNDYLNDDGVLAYMQEIADVADRFLAFDRPSREVRDQLDTLAAEGDGQVEAIAERLDDLKEMSVIRLTERLEDIRADLVRDNRPRSAERLGVLVNSLREAVARAERDPVAVYQREVPASSVAITALRDRGFELDVRSLRAIGKYFLYQRYGGPEWMRTLPDAMFDDDARAMLDLFVENNNAEFVEGLQALLPFLRAKVLLQTYHMDPGFMHEVMVRYGAADWRHPNSHSMYWAALGVEKGRGLRDAEDIDYINTKRLVIHSIQAMVDFGSVAYNPLLPVGGQVDLMPSPTFIDAYGDALDETIEDAKAGKFGNISVENFESGHENFLHKAVMLSYLYGSEAKAQEYYDQLRERYANKPHNLRDRRYEQPLADLVWEFIKADLESITQTTVRYLFEGMLVERAFGQGLVYGRLNVFNQIVTRVKEFYDRYQQERVYATGLETKGRLELPPFPQMVEDAFTRFMQDPRRDLMARQAAYRNAPLPLVQRTYPRWIGNVTMQAGEGADMASLFPEPPGVTEAQIEAGDAEIGGGQIERK